VDEAHALLELRLLVLLGRGSARSRSSSTGSSSCEPLRGARDQLLLVARGPLAVVVELRLESLERVEVLVTLSRHLGERIRLLDLFLGLFLGGLRLVGHDFAAPSSSSITS
jgi:hypothetical protein